ncbi:MAG TPA: NTP transferase domain-containing protein [Patescibacteria group bacterium]|nr:NTP transferase domain-containing protein [Patescibacteria group bacterium]
MSQQIVILAAGKGTRMGADIPKVLLPLGDTPVISRLLESIKTVPQDTAPIIVVGFEKEKVMDTLGSEYIYVEQFDLKGTAHAALSAKSKVTADNIIVLNGDMPFMSKETLSKLAEQHVNTQAMVSMLTCKLPNFENEFKPFISYGRILRDETGHIVKIQEVKDCSEEQKLITEVNTGEYMFNSAWLWDKLELIKDNNSLGEFYLTDIVEIAIADGQKIQSLPVAPQEIYGINIPDDLEQAKNLLNSWK